MQTRFGWIGMCLLLVILSLVAKGAQKYTFGAIKINEFSEKEGDKDPLYSVMLGQARVGARRSELEMILRYQKRKYGNLNRLEDLEGTSFESEEHDSSDLAFDQLLSRARGTDPSRDQFFDQLARGLAETGRGGACFTAEKMASATAREHFLKTAFTPGTPCGSLDLKFLEELRKRVAKSGFDGFAVEVSAKKEINGSHNVCREYLHLKKNGRPVVKFSLGPSANGFECSKKAEDLQESAVPLTSKSAGFPSKPKGPTRLLIPPKKTPVTD